MITRNAGRTMTPAESKTDRSTTAQSAQAECVRSVWWIKHLSLLTLLQAAFVSLGLALHQQAFPAEAFVATIGGVFVISRDVLLGFVWITAIQGGIGYLYISHFVERIRSSQDNLQSEFSRKQDALTRTQNALIVGLTKLAASRDGDTEGHLDRVGLYASRIASVAGERPEFQNEITPQFIETIRVSAALHDIGKVGIEDSILQKPGRLTDEERRQMQTHTRISSDCLQQVQQCLGDSNFLQMAHEIALFHHEHWNGEGYPTGLRREQIPLAARIVAIADVYDALSARRCYKEPYAHQQCVDMIVEAAGTQFDPRLVEVFQQVESEFRAIAARFPDTAPSVETPANGEPGLDSILEGIDVSLEAEPVNA